MREKSGNHRKYSRSLSNCSVQEFDVYSLSNSPYKKFYADFGKPKTRKLKLSTSKDDKMEINVICTSYCARNSMFDKDTKNQATLSVQGKGDHENATKSPDDDNATETKKTTSDTNSSILKIMTNIALLYKNPVYILISLCVATYFWVFIPILTVVVDYSRDKGISEADSIYLIHALTVGDLIGRLCFGWVTDKSILTFPVFMTLTFVFQGVFVSLLPFASSFWPYMSLLVLYGVTAGIVFVHFPVLVHKYVDQKDQSIAMGCVGLLSGVVTFGIPSLIGYFRDHVGSYDGLLYIIGLVSIVTGALWLFEPIFLKFGDRKEVDADHK